ncbi:MAG: response regulator transcription factor [Melioribacteraceae bacterium]
MNTKILLVDDEKDIVEFLKYNLVHEGFDVITAYNGKEALEKLDEKPDLIILDVLMPKMDGYQACLSIRNMAEFKDTPSIFLTAKGSEVDEVHGLSLGADDYIQKPISPQKLIARVKSNLRRIESSHDRSAGLAEIRVGNLIIDREKYTVTLEGIQIIFPKKEFEILNYLASNRGKVFSRDKILKDIWGEDIFVIERTVDVHVRKIREKLGVHSDLIETIKGVGYRFKNIE